MGLVYVLRWVSELVCSQAAESVWRSLLVRVLELALEVRLVSHQAMRLEPRRESTLARRWV